MKSIFVIALAVLATFAAATDSNDDTKDAWSDYSFQHYGQPQQRGLFSSLAGSALGSKLVGDSANLVAGQGIQFALCAAGGKSPKDCANGLKDGLLQGSLGLLGGIGKRDVFNTIKNKLKQEIEEFGNCVVSGTSFTECVKGLKDLIPGREKRGLFDNLAGNLLGNKLVGDSANLVAGQTIQFALCTAGGKSAKDCANDLKNGLLQGSLGLVGSIGKRDIFETIKSKLTQEVEELVQCFGSGAGIKQCLAGLKDLIPGREKRGFLDNLVANPLANKLVGDSANLVAGQGIQFALCAAGGKSPKDCANDLKNGLLQGSLGMLGGIGKRDIFSNIKNKLKQEIEEFGDCVSSGTSFVECVKGLKDLIPGREKRGLFDNLAGNLLGNKLVGDSANLVAGQTIQFALCTAGGKSAKDCANDLKNGLLQGSLGLVGSIGKRDLFDTIKSKVKQEVEELVQCFGSGAGIKQCLAGLKDLIPGREKRGFLDSLVANPLANKLVGDSANLVAGQGIQFALCAASGKSPKDCANGLKDGLLQGSLGMLGGIGKRDIFSNIKNKLKEEIEEFGNCVSSGTSFVECVKGLKDLIPGREKRGLFDNLAGNLLGNKLVGDGANLVAGQTIQFALCTAGGRSAKDCANDLKNGLLQGGLALAG